MIQLEFQQKLSGRLLPRERILWAGRPRQGFMFQEGDAFALPFALLWTLGAVGLPLTSGHITWSLNSLFLLPFLVASFYMLIGRYLHDAWGRSRTFYAVTDRRVLIWREGPQASFKALDRDGLAQMEREGAGRTGHDPLRSGGGDPTEPTKWPVISCRWRAVPRHPGCAGGVRPASAYKAPGDGACFPRCARRRAERPGVKALAPPTLVKPARTRPPLAPPAHAIGRAIRTLKGAMPSRASSSARSFSGWPAWPFTQCQRTL